MRRAAVLGGGISGLACAHRLLELKKESGADWEVSVFEAGPRFGGVIRTERRDGFILEKGPDSFLSEKPWAADLSSRLGLNSEMIGTNPAHRKSFALKKGRLLPVPEGFYLIAPTKVWAFLSSPLFSLPTKIRILLEPFIPKKVRAGDESIGSFIRRRFGQRALEDIGQAMVAGIHTGDPENLSLEATFPKFLELEQRYGSLTRGLRALPEAPLRSARGPRYSLFLSFKEGMETLVKGLIGRIPGDRLQANCGARSIRYDPSAGEWVIALENGRTKTAQAVCLGLPGYAAARVLREALPELARELDQIRYESVATVNFAYRRAEIRHALDGFGFVVPAAAKKSLVACSFSSQKFQGRAPQGFALLRAFVGGAFGLEFFNRDDKDLVQTVQRDLSSLLGIAGPPLFWSLERHPRSMVQYRLGHLDLVSGIERGLSGWPGLFLAGAAYHGTGIPDCVKDAQDCAGRMHRFIKGGKGC